MDKFESYSIDMKKHDQNNLEQLLQNAEEAVVETPEGDEPEGDTEEVAEEDSTEES